MLALDDADVDKAVDGAVRACFSNSGQLCISIERIYIPATLWDEFTSRFAAATKKMKLSAALDHSTDMGSLISEKQLLTMSRRVDDAVSMGGLNFSVWTSDPKRGRRVAARLQAGTVNVNDAYAAAWASVDAPMGGMKASGMGRRHGEHGMLKYTESPTIAVEHLLPAGAPTWLDAGRYARIATAAMRLLLRIPGVK